MNKDTQKDKKQPTPKRGRIVIEEIDDSRLEEADGGRLHQGTEGVPNSNQCQCA